jgi:phosphatidate cytidylyltransferase
VLDPNPSIYSLTGFALLSLLQIILYLRKKRSEFIGSLQILWIFFLVLTLSEWISFAIALWILAFFSFYVLREYLSLVDIRLEDRLGIFISYLAIPFMFYLIQIKWYGLFIISIPVYSFLLIPFFVALGKNSKGIVFSVGMLDFGLFFYVFCMGHLGFLMFYSEKMTILFVLTIAITGFIFNFFKKRTTTLRLALSVPLSAIIYLLAAAWSGVPASLSVALGIILPFVAGMGHFTLKELEKDLGIRPDRLQPGRGKYITAAKLYLFSAPVAFHFLRWFLKWGDLP